MMAVLLMAACTKGIEVGDIPQLDYASVSFSSPSAVFPMEGGEKTIFVVSNREDWEVECDADWLDISVEEHSLTFFVDPNNTKDSRMAVIEVVAGTDPDMARARFKLFQTGLSMTDLSAAGKANCYIAQTGESYRFDASVKGTGSNDGNSFYINYHGGRIKGAAYADLVWESTFDADKTRSTDIISGYPVYSPEEKAVYFSTGNVEGNASICVCDGEGRILWSWHIWVTDSPVSVSKANGLEWMDRNLGALNNEPGNLANRGMLYQWGRKDPFLPSCAPYVNVPTHKYDEDYNVLETEEEYNAIQTLIEQAREKVNILNTQTGNGFGKWTYAGEPAPVALQAPGNIEYSVQNPTTLLGCRVDVPIGEYVFDWYLQQDLQGSGGALMQSKSELWGKADAGTAYKSMFDPCPAGYAVPPRGAFADIPNDYACSFVDREWTDAECGWNWNGMHFPSAGNMDVSGLIGETGERMLYWTAETFGSGVEGYGKAATLFVAFNDVYYGIYPLLDPAQAGSWYSYGARCYAASVRCVKYNN